MRDNFSGDRVFQLKSERLGDCRTSGIDVVTDFINVIYRNWGEKWLLLGGFVFWSANFMHISLKVVDFTKADVLERIAGIFLNF